MTLHHPTWQRDCLVINQLDEHGDVNEQIALATNARHAALIEQAQALLAIVEWIDTQSVWIPDGSVVVTLDADEFQVLQETIRKATRP